MVKEKAPVHLELDSYMEDFEYEDIRHEINTLIKDFEEDSFYISANNLGWRHTKGTTVKSIVNIQDLMACFPNTDLNLKLDFFEDRIEASCSHHDAMNENYLFENLTAKKIIKLYRENSCDLQSLLEQGSSMKEKEKDTLFKEVIKKNIYEDAYDLMYQGYSIEDEDRLVKFIPLIKEHNSGEVLKCIRDNYSQAYNMFRELAEQE